MDNRYNGYFFNDFYAQNGGGNYMEKDRWTDFFNGIADAIIKDFNPESTLEVGCASGYLIKALRDRGVNAYGFDISEYAIAHCAESIADYVAVASADGELPENFPQKYDMVITIEVLEHLLPEQGKTAISKMCGYADTVLFTSTPDDIEDRTHCNVQQSEYWAKLFAENSFYHDLVQPVDFICPWAMLFRKRDSVTDVIFDYEMNKRIDRLFFEKEIAQRESNISKIYFDCEEGFSEENTFKISYSGNILRIRELHLPAGCRGVRFDPAEGYNCIVSNLVIGSSNGILSVQGGNNDRFIDGSYFFSNSDPQLYIPIPNGTVWIEISCNIVMLENIFAQKAIRDLEILSDLKENEIEEKRAIISNLEEKSAQFEREVEEKNAVISNLEEKSTQFERDIEEKRAIISNLEERSAQFERDVEEKNAQFEKFIKEKKNVISKQEEENAVLNSRIKALLCEKANAEAELATYQEHYHAAIGQREQLKSELAAMSTELAVWQNSYNSISRSQFWRITAPARKVCDGIKKILKSNKVTYLFCKGLLSLKREGVKATWRKVKMKYSSRYRLKEIAKNMSLSAQERKQQEETVFSKNIKFSILVPLYNTPINFLEEMIASVIGQTYGNWELCLADGSDKDHGNVGKTVKRIQANEKRIKYRKLEKNLGISENTNACIDMATGDYIALFDHDDILHPAALFEMMKAICDKNADFIYTDEATFESPNLNKIITAHFKPDFAIDNLHANNYICHFSAFSRDVLEEAGKFRHEYDGSQDHDMILRLTAVAANIVHIPQILYYWRSHPLSVSQDINSKVYAINAGKNAVKADINRKGYNCVVGSSRAFPTIYRIKYDIVRNSKVSIIIPNKNHLEDLKKCISSILNLSTYSNYEIVIVDNDSDDVMLFEYYEELKKDSKFIICSCNIPFNYSKLNNYAVTNATGEYYILLNNDIEIITPEWIEEMLMFVQRTDVGAAGALLLYPDDTIQHAGVILGLGTDRIAGHAYHRMHKSHIGYMGRLCYAQDMTAVTAACMMVKASVYKEVDGLDEDFKVAYNDVDFCMKIRKKGYLIVWTPFAEAYHYESKSRGYEDTPEKQKRFKEEVKLFREKWSDELEAGDPYYNPNLTLDRGDFSLK